MSKKNNIRTMEKRTYGPPTVTRVVPLLPELAVLAGSDPLFSPGAGVNTGGHEVGSEINFENSTTFNHEWD